MTKASDNVFPRLLISEGGSTSTPSSGRVTVYAKANGLLYAKDDAGTETALGGSAGSVATDAIWDAAGDLALGTGANTAAKLAIGANGYVLTSNGTTASWAAASGGGGARGFDAITLDGTYGDAFAAGDALDADWNGQNVDRKEIGIDAVTGGAFWMAAETADARSMWRALTPDDEVDVTASWVHYGVGDVIVGPYIVDSSGTGVAAGLRSSDTSFNAVVLASYAYSSFGETRTITRQEINDEGIRVWGQVCKRRSYYVVRYSFDGAHWGQPLVCNPSSFTVARVGFGRVHGAVDSHVYLDRFNATVLGTGNNLVTTPTSGTATYTASSEFSGSFLAGNAANGNPASGEWAANGNGDSPIYWQVAWSVGQSLNRVVLFCRTEDFGSGYLEMTDGGTTWTHPLPNVLRNGKILHVDFPTHTGVTSLKVVSKAGFGGNPGLNEVEAYLAS